MSAYYETADGRTVPLREPMSPEESAVTYLMHAVGIRRIDADTIDEFVQRADLYDTYIGGSLLRDLSTGEDIAMTRKILTETMGDNVALWNDARLIDPGTFNRMIRISKAAR